MPAAPTLTAVPSPHGRRTSPEPVVLVSVQGSPDAPPAVHEIRAEDPAELIESVFEAAATAGGLPVLAVREVVENLVHADFADAVVTVLPHEGVLRCADHGPGIPDTARALTPGFSTADQRARRVIRGVGSGLPLASATMEAAGGELLIEPNLGSGTVVTLRGRARRGPAVEQRIGDGGQALLALLLEIGPAGVARIAQELDRPLAACGRDLTLLEHRGLVSRAADGRRSLTEAGEATVATLF